MTIDRVSQLDTQLLPSLVSDYVQGKTLTSSLAKYPFTLSAFENVIADKSKETINRALLVEVLQSQYQDTPSAEVVRTNIESLLSENTFTVTAAHQPCLFMGPLYNIYKIASAINVAQQLSRAFPDKHFVPVFWMGSEDHDVEELNHTFVSGKRIAWENPGSGASGRWNTQGVSLAIEELKQSNISGVLVDSLEESLKKYSSFGKLTQFFVNEIFKEHGLVVLDQDDKRFKKAFSKVILDEVSHFTASKVLAPTLAFLNDNYKVQASPREINFFYLGDGFRERIVWNETTGKFEVLNQAVAFTKEEIENEIAHHPEKFSPNVILRPLYQEAILPNLAFTGGGGELSYWLQLKPLFEHYQVNFPMLLLRPSMAILSSGAKKKAEKLGLNFQDFFQDTELLIKNYVSQQLSEDSSLTEEKERVSALFDLAGDKAERVDATLKSAAQAEKQKAIAALENLENKMLKAEKRKQETAIAQIRAVKEAMFPDGVLQERRENFLTYYSPEFVHNIVELADPFQLQFFILSEL